MKKLLVGSRESRLAVLQTRIVTDLIQKHHPDYGVELVTMKTGKGLCVRELDQALLDRRADITVHSLKDMPMETDPRLPILAYSRREDPRDALVLPLGQTELDPQKPIGCASARRRIQLEKLFPGCRVEPVRGNVLTRLEKLDRGDYGALVLASAGLRRLGLEERIRRLFSPEEMLPAAGQGILAVQGREDFDRSLLREVDDKDSAACALCERAFVRFLDGGCSSPVAAYAQADGETLRLRGLYWDEQGWEIDETRGSVTDAEELGTTLARTMAARRGK